jgi:hypothetical protein
MRGFWVGWRGERDIQESTIRDQEAWVRAAAENVGREESSLAEALKRAKRLMSELKFRSPMEKPKKHAPKRRGDLGVGGR